MQFQVINNFKFHFRLKSSPFLMYVSKHSCEIKIRFTHNFTLSNSIIFHFRFMLEFLFFKISMNFLWSLDRTMIGYFIMENLNTSNLFVCNFYLFRQSQFISPTRTSNYAVKSQKRNKLKFYINELFALKPAHLDLRQIQYIEKKSKESKNQTSSLTFSITRMSWKIQNYITRGY